MNNPSVEQLADPRFYLENFCKIKGKLGKGLEPFVLKPAQLDIFNTIKKHNRIIIMKARQIGFCLSSDTKILTSDLRWIEIKDLKVGDKLVSVEENPPTRKTAQGRKMKESIVEKKCSIFEEAFEITMTDGSKLKATGKHRFLVSSDMGTEWKTVDSMRSGDKIRKIVNVWGDPSYEDGWFSGIIDGEGSLSKKTRTGVSLSISQVEGDVLDRIFKYLDSNKILYRIEWDRREKGIKSKLGNKPVCKAVISRLSEVFKIIGKTRPSRMIKKNWWIDKSLPAGGNSYESIVSIKSIGKQEMIDLQTSEHTYIANGFVSHNSTAVTGYLYHKTITTAGVSTAIVGYNNDLTAELLDKIKTFIRTTPAEFRPTIQYNSKYEISFPKLDSKIIVLPSTENVGRGYTINYALLTELPFWDKAEEKLGTLEASVPINGKIIIESSPGAVGDFFHRMWVSDNNDYIKKEYGWWWNYTEDEVKTIERRMNDPRKFNNNYALEFLVSGRSVFTEDAIRNQRKNVLKVGDKVKLEDGSEFIVREEDGFRIYKPPERGHFYVVGADCAEGVEGGDYSVGVIIDRTTGEEVGFYRGHIAPDRFAKILDKYGRQYYNALMVVESEAHGNVVLNVLKTNLYPSLYFRPSRFDGISNPWSDKLGWKTTKLTRPIIIDELEQITREKDLILHSKEIVDEMTVFVYNDANNAIAMDGYHDDCIFATAIALQGFKVLSTKPMTQLDYTGHLPNIGY